MTVSYLRGKKDKTLQLHSFINCYYCLKKQGNSCAVKYAFVMKEKKQEANSDQVSHDFKPVSLKCTKIDMVITGVRIKTKT